MNAVASARGFAFFSAVMISSKTGRAPRTLKCMPSTVLRSPVAMGASKRACIQCLRRVYGQGEANPRGTPMSVEGSVKMRSGRVRGRGREATF